MIISLFMNDAPPRPDGDCFHARTEHGPTGQEAGEVPHRERENQKFSHRRPDSRKSSGRTGCAARNLFVRVPYVSW
jgi:hypothetical protein